MMTRKMMPDTMVKQMTPNMLEVSEFLRDTPKPALLTAEVAIYMGTTYRGAEMILEALLGRQSVIKMRVMQEPLRVIFVAGVIVGMPGMQAPQPARISVWFSPERVEEAVEFRHETTVRVKNAFNEYLEKINGLKFRGI